MLAHVAPYVNADLRTDWELKTVNMISSWLFTVAQGGVGNTCKYSRQFANIYLN